jgi:serine protease AprX
MKNLLKILILSIPLWGLGGYSFAQNKYFVLFKDKANSPYSVAKPTEFLSARSIQRRDKQKIKVTERDLPPNPAYINEVRKLGKVWYKSRWFNGVLVETTEANLASILKLTFVKGIEGKGDLVKARLGNENKTTQLNDKFEVLTTNDNGLSANQLAMLGVDKMQEKNLRGEGMWIGVLDSGFQNSDKLPFFKHLYDEKRILGTYDFVFNETSVYEDHNHGTNVLSCMAAFTDNQIVGTAPKASYLLLKTEDVRSETKLEEANWAFAAEFADSVGVDVINTSLGYTEFDSKVQNYTQKDLNGKTAIITRAADFASATGILVVVSAGNEGGGAWQKIGTPADADSVISVGAVNATQVRASFSSLGGKFTNLVKPELAAQGQGTIVGATNGAVSSSNGTSFSSPLLAGMAASFWAAYPKFNNMEIRDILIKSGSQFAKPDSLLGYGIPNFERAAKIAESYNVVAAPLNMEEESANSVIVSPNPFNNEISVQIVKPSISNQYEVNLIDARGRNVVKFNAVETNFKIQTELSAGIYFLNINSVGMKVVKRIIKE